MDGKALLRVLFNGFSICLRPFVTGCVTLPIDPARIAVRDMFSEDNFCVRILIWKQNECSISMSENMHNSTPNYKRTEFGWSGCK